MVSALNRTAPVQPDGTWVLPNVPANVGLVRVRATCVDGDTVRAGSSDLLLVPVNGALSVADISFASPARVPVSLALSATTTSLTAAGQGVQLVATATYGDGSTADLGGDPGTTFRSSNAAIVTVSSSGLVTATGSGVAMITALNEGAVAVTRFQVTLAGSTVGDGIPDDWKVAHGLDPNDPYVAMEDPDNDGLTNLEEYQNGTDPHNPDTDGDGLSDGDEVHLYHTDPTLWDTDGDGISDGVEVQTGSNPLDGHSFNLAAALSSVTVTPAAFTIVFNTVSGEASQQLAAQGQVIDGRTIDLFNPLYQTTVTSSDLSVANFGPQLGRVYAGQSGSATITVSNSGFSALDNATVTTFSPTVLGFLPVPGFQNAVDVMGDFAFLASGGFGLSVVDVTNLASPVLLTQVPTLASANDVRVAGAVAYLALDSGLQLFDVSDPAHPAPLGSLSFPGGQPVRLAVYGTTAFLADLTSGLHIVDASNPMKPVEVGSLALDGTPRAVSLGGTGFGGFGLAGSYAVVACGDAGLEVVDVSDPTNPVLLGESPLAAPRAGSVTVRGHYAYVASAIAGVYGGLHTLELADPTDPVEVGASEDDLGMTRAVLEDGFALGSQFFIAGQVPIFDVSGPAPVPSALLNLNPNPGGLAIPAPRANDVAVRNGAVFLAANGDLGEFMASGSSPSGLYTGLYKLPVDGDAGPPAVSITAPAAGSVVMERLPITVSVSAQDAVSVTSVAIQVNGVVVETLYKPPYQVSIPVPVGNPTLILGATATNISGVSATTRQTFTVQAYPLPVANLLAPVQGQRQLFGTPLTIAVAASDAVAVTRVDVFVNGQLAGSTDSPPYLFQVDAPSGSPSMTVAAQAYDALGPGAISAPVFVNLRPAVPPTVTIFTPLDGAQVTEGSVVTILAGASDETGVTAVTFDRDGVEFQNAVAPPYTVQVVAPPAGQTMILGAMAFDNVGVATQSPRVTVTSILDPGTALTGIVVDPGGAPASGATVVANAGAFSASATTGADGSFSLDSLPTNAGDFAVSALGTLNGCPAGASRDVPQPPPGQSESLGYLTITPDPTPQPTLVTGTLVDADGQGISGVSVTVSSVDLADTTTVETGAGGAFVAAAFPSRAWPLQAEAAATVGGVSYFANTGTHGPVPVQGGTTDLGALVLAPYPFTGDDPLTTVTGVATNLDGTPAAGAQVVIDTGAAQVVTSAGSDGSFSVPSIPTLQGTIVVTASRHLPCNVLLVAGPLTVDSLVGGGATVVNLPQLVPAPGPPSTIIFTWAPTGGWRAAGERCALARNPPSPASWPPGANADGAFLALAKDSSR